MKKILLLVCLSISLATYAQLQLKSNGNINIGVEPIEDINLPMWSQDTTSTLKIFGKNGDLKGGARISFGDVTRYNMNAMIGELGEDDTDLLWLQGKKGLYFTASPSAQDTICYYDQNKGNYVQFNCDVRASGIFVASDSRFKENITPLDNSLPSINQLSAVSYKLKPKFSSNSNSSSRSRSASTSTSKEAADAAFYSEYYNKLQNETPRFGFVAQEVKEIFPELVRTDSAGYMYVDYVGMIPLLVNAINELKAELDSTKENNGKSIKKVSPTGSVDDIAESDITPKLFQNAPNPFSSVTTIKFTLPESVQTAMLCIYDMQGKQLKQIDVTERGTGNISIQGSDLQAGMYIYALIADGNEIDSKRMILTK